jgi:hypothetical protein
MQLKHSHNVLKMYKNWRKIAGLHANEDYPTVDETYYEAFWQAIIAGHLSDGKSDLRDAFVAWENDVKKLDRRRIFWMVWPTYEYLLRRITKIPMLAFLISPFVPLIWSLINALGPDILMVLSSLVLQRWQLDDG